MNVLSRICNQDSVTNVNENESFGFAKKVSVKHSNKMKLNQQTSWESKKQSISNCRADCVCVCVCQVNTMDFVYLWFGFTCKHTSAWFVDITEKLQFTKRHNGGLKRTFMFEYNLVVLWMWHATSSEQQSNKQRATKDLPPVLNVWEKWQKIAMTSSHAPFVVFNFARRLTEAVQ